MTPGTPAAMWAAIGVHAALTAAGVDEWRAMLTADVLWHARPETRTVPSARSEPGIGDSPVWQALKLATRLAGLATTATGLQVAIKAAGTTDTGEAWATFVEPRTGAVTTVPVGEDARALVAIATLLRGAR